LYSQLEELTENVEKSLDLLNVVFGNIDKKAKLEIFLNEPVVKDLIEDIRMARYAVLLIANYLDAPFNTRDLKENDDTALEEEAEHRETKD
jgi:hypothetical protein